MFRSIACVGLLFAAGAASAGSYYRCDDGSGTTKYQSVACGTDSLTQERRVYEDAVPLNSESRRAAPKPPPRSRSSKPNARSARAQAPIVAYSCRLGSEQWVQTGPCATLRSHSGDKVRELKPHQQGLTQVQVCRLVRDGLYAEAPYERPSDSAYRRNLLRDRGGC